MLETLTANNIDIKTVLQDLTKQIADLHWKLDNQPTPSPPNQASTAYHSPPNNQQPPLLSIPTITHNPKCTLSSFDGSNPHNWIFQADRSFTYYSMPEDQHVELVSFHMQGKALTWIQWMHRNKQLTY